MKDFIFLAGILIISLLACQEEELRLVETYQLCTTEFIYVDTARTTQNVLTANELPVSIRAFVAAEFPGTSISEARSFQTIDGLLFREVKLDLIGYVLFDENNVYRCVIERYPRIVQEETTIATGDTASTNTDNNLIVLIEEGSCDATTISFKHLVHPILVSNCAQSDCHNRIDKAEGISVETYSDVIEEVRAGDAQRSRHYRSITRDPNHRDFMPERPRDPLLASEIEIIGEWINQGANDTDCLLPCNSTATSFTNDIQPLFKIYCYGCHQAEDKQGGISMEDYEHILDLVGDGSLVGSMKHAADFVAMPLYLDKMTDCQVAQVENWIKEGAQNN